MRPRQILNGVALTMLSGSAFAQDRGPFTPPADDTSLGILREVFGNVVDFVIGNGAGSLASNDTVIGAGFEVFNTAVLFLGMIFVAYSTISGVINTAHDGEFLGRKMNSIWVPLRTVAGSALLLPLAGGFSLIQILIMWLGLQGVGVADRAWIAMLDRVDQTGMINHPSMPNARPLVANILRFEVCRLAMNKHYAESGRPDRVSVQEKTYLTRAMVPTDDVVSLGAAPLGMGYKPVMVPVTDFSWAATNGSYIEPEICGSLNWEESSESDAGNAKYLDTGNIRKAHREAVRATIAAMTPVAQQIVDGNKPGPELVLQAAYAYENRLRQAAKSAVDNANSRPMDAFVNFAKEGGWVNAGAYYNHIISLNDAVQLSLNSLPSSTASDISNKEAADALVGYADAMAVTEEFLRARSYSTSAAYKDELRLDAEACLPMPTGWEDLRKCLSRPALAGIELITQNMAGSNTSHISQVKSIGDIIMNVAWVQAGTLFITGGLADAKAVDWTVGLGFSLKGALGSLAFLLNAMIMVLLASGAMMAFYIPLIPFIAWTAGVIKWVVSIAEAMVAAPIFAAAHIHPDGDDAVGRAGPGYMIILSVIMRPILMLFGLILSIGVAQPISHLVNGGYMLAVKGAMHDSANGLGALVAYSVIYAIIQTTVLHAVFSLINFVPDRTFRWMGSAVGMEGIADNEARESQHVFAGAASHSRSVVGGGHGGKDGQRSGPNDGGGGTGDKGGGGNQPTDADLAPTSYGGGSTDRTDAT
ncbi:DotA/TraY family protein [Pseudoxanthomonas kaohsiungensis]|uniref:DotA/TraY family protein n=1 Tax=Pseudoxanthomonas kaohsiungensis TaxID=283923 RepID=A0ABW3LX95_9GAMM|nr:DotA/TraY family protein [Pseudoxanthomonas kaohsiungensis]